MKHVYHDGKLVFEMRPWSFAADARINAYRAATEGAFKDQPLEHYLLTISLAVGSTRDVQVDPDVPLLRPAAEFWRRIKDIPLHDTVGIVEAFQFYQEEVSINEVHNYWYKAYEAENRIDVPDYQAPLEVLTPEQLADPELPKDAAPGEVQ